MQNELNTNKYFKLAYSANRCRCAVKLVPGASSSWNFVEGNPPRPSTPPQSEKSARKLIRTP
ncbi:Hypothetical protein FKW44_005317 [Caligus rogercresseyi]|uniref:Uncharacterized protein n=1 Tax=Caligus rogercresseyi TaxID=217165 RepID=A0A7T8QRX6_CALRO|nr:Hypothetical protein FKW44_005317 [Caligus rogercresseyi]